MGIGNKNPLKFKQVSERNVEWSYKKKSVKDTLNVFKQVSERNVEWSSKKKPYFKDFIRFLDKLKKSKQPMTYIYKFTKYKFFKELNKQFPKSTVFLSKVLEKYPHNIKFIYAPGMAFVSPFFIANKFKVTEKILLKLYQRGISVDQILKNEKITMSILSKNFLLRYFDKSKAFEKYILFIEKEIRGNVK